MHRSRRPRNKSTDPEFLLERAVACHQWHRVWVLVHSPVSDTKREWALRKAILYADDSKLEVALDTAVARRLWSAVTDVLQRPRKISDTKRAWAVREAIQQADNENLKNILPLCADGQLEEALDTAVARRLWPAITYVLQKRKISDTKRAWAVDEALRHADSTNLTPILPHCNDGQLDSVLTEAATRGLWDSVDKLLSRDPSDGRRQWALDQAIQHADDSQMQRLLKNHSSKCDTDHLSSLFTQAVTRGLWGCVRHVQWQSILADLPPEQQNWVLSEACKRAAGCELSYIIREFCNDDNVETVLPDLIRRREWRTVSEVFDSFSYRVCGFRTKKVTLTETQKRWIVVEASEYAEETDLNLLLKYCPDNLLDTVVKKAVERRFWRSVSQLLRAKASKIDAEVCKLAVEEATTHAGDNEFESIIKHKTNDQLDLVLTSAVTRHLWDVVVNLLGCEETYLYAGQKIKTLQGLSTDRIQHAFEEASKHAHEDEIFRMVRRGPCDGISLDPVLTETVKRGLWETVSETLKRGVSDAMRKWAVEEAAKYTGYVSVQNMKPIFQQCADDQLDLVLTAAVKRKMWTCVGTLLTREASEPHRRWVLGEASKDANDKELFEMIHYCADDQLNSMLTTLVERNLWECTKYLLNRDASDPHRRRVLEEVSKKANDTQLLEMIHYCGDDQLNSMLTTIVERNLWECMKYLLNRDASEPHRRRVLEEVSKNATDDRLLEIIRYCADDQTDSLLTTAVERKLWKCLKYLLNRNASEPHRRRVLEEVSKYAKDDQLLEMIHYCADDQLDSLLATAVGRKLWKCFVYLLHLGVSSTKKTWAIEEASQSAPEQTLLDIFDRHPVDTWYDSALVATLRRCLLKAVRLLLCRLTDALQIKSVVKKAADGLTQDERDRVVKTAVCHKAWAIVCLMLEQSHVSDDTKGRIIGNVLTFAYSDVIVGDSVFRVVVQHCNSSQLMREAVKQSVISIARDVLTRIGQYGNPLAVTDDGRTVLQVVMETVNCRRPLVAECIKLGISTHQPPVTDSVQRPSHVLTSSTSRRNTYYRSLSTSVYRSLNTSVYSPLCYAVLKCDLKLVAMLWESGSCSPKELHTVIDSITVSKSSADPDTPDTTSQDITSYLETVASTPRSLRSACRLAISHHLGVGCRRHERVKQLPLPEKLRNYVLFSDLVDPETGASAQNSERSSTMVKAGVSSTADASPDSVHTLLQWEVEHAGLTAGPRYSAVLMTSPFTYAYANLLGGLYVDRGYSSPEEDYYDHHYHYNDYYDHHYHYDSDDDYGYHNYYDSD